MNIKQLNEELSIVLSEGVLEKSGIPIETIKTLKSITKEVLNLELDSINNNEKYEILGNS